MQRTGHRQAEAARSAAAGRLHLSLVRTDASVAGRPGLGQILCDMGALSPDALVAARQVQKQQASGLGETLIGLGWIDESQLMTALARQYQTEIITTAQVLPDPVLLDRLGLRDALRTGCLPWKMLGGVTLVATSRPDQFDRHRAELEARFGPVAMALISESALHQTIMRTRRLRLRLWAETCVSVVESCRSMRFDALRYMILAGLGALVVLGCLYPTQVFAALAIMTTVFLLLSAFLKLGAALASLHVGRADPGTAPDPERLAQDGAAIVLQRKPVVTILVPLFKEPRTVPRLIRRLSRLTWPRNLLDIILVVEENDSATRQALESIDMPRWMRQVIVPEARLKTKPRALNYAMQFARGSLIGVYDAEDAPEPDQIHRVVSTFQNGPPTLACVQGVLDFYNPRANLLARCFTIEYAVWFRLVLPGLQRMGLVVPLGGTTLFFRRDVLERLGGWDAHNVTEDADLGIRLARHGYYTALLDTVTYEEANCRVIPWVKQRSRWLKGYAVTWLVHMRDPVQLWRQLGPWRFFGVQVLFLGTLVQFMLAPLLWSFWLVLAGITHPLLPGLGAGAMAGFVAAFLFSEAVNLSIGLLALRARHHRSLRWWLPCLHGYFPLAVLAVYKALWELVWKPFYWDKTSHGHHVAALDGMRVHGQG